MAERFERIGLLSSARSYEVWDAWDHDRGARVILKTAIRKKRGKERIARRLLAEGALLAELSHPHIVRAYETLSDPEPVLVMESLGGATLSHMIEAEPPLADTEIAMLGLQLTSAISYLHRNGRLHLDLKPSNVIAEAGRARLIDLGLATTPGPVEPGTGTWCYMAPEQARGGLAGEASDTWGLGATLFESACGFPPFADPAVDDEDEEFPQLERGARPVAEASRGARRNGEPVAGDLAELIDRCLLADPRERPTLGRVAEILEPLAGLPSEERRLSRGLLRGQEVAA